MKFLVSYFKRRNGMQENINKLILKLGFALKDQAIGIFMKTYAGGYSIEVNSDEKTIYFGSKIKVQNKDTQNINRPEDIVVMECVDRLLEAGYKPEHIILEKVYPAGHGNSGRLDICVTRSDGSEYLLIECKTYGKEFDKAFTRLKKDGGQLFTYFKFSNKADLIVLYASELNNDEIIYRNEIVKIEYEYRTGDVKDFYEKWSKLTKDNGVFDKWVKPYNFESKALTPKQLEAIRQEDSGFIFSQFLEILRHNVVSDKPNAFNKIFTLFLCKVYDEKNTKLNEELKFQWFEGRDKTSGEDAYVDFLLRLSDLYKGGMLEFLEKEITDFSEEGFKKKYNHLDDSVRKEILKEFNKIRLEKNNEFAIKDVFDHQSFLENSKIVKEVVELLQRYRIRYNKRHQYLSDFFELLLTTGLKQESGQFFTPVPIAQFIIKSLPINKFINSKLEKGERDNLLPFIIDYASGSGHFLTESMHEMQRHLDAKNPNDYIEDTAKKIKTWQEDHFDWANQYVYGVEKDYRLVKVGKVGCYLHGDGLANVIHSDGLARFDHPDYKRKLHRIIKNGDYLKDNQQFDIVISNPPYSVSSFRNTTRDYYTEVDFDLYRSLTDNSSEIECLFIERTKQLLKDDGVAGIILPSSILSNTGIYTESREMILKYFVIIAIAEFGSNTFMATGTNTVTLFLRRRNNYESNNLRISVDKFFVGYQDITLNGVEKPVAKYVHHVWTGISFNDYVSLLKKEPNEVICKHEIYCEYRNKLKAKKEAEFWALLLDRESEKIYYFILAYPQKLVLVKSGEKDAEKRLLGYEFSNRRGKEGIHPIKSGKSIEECTRLFDSEIFDNPKKASTYIYKAFQGDFTYPVDPELENNISRHNLVDMLTFNRVDFEKTISLSVKKNVNFEFVWKIDNLKFLSEIADIKKGTSINKEEAIAGSIPVIAGGQGVAYYHNKANRSGDVITVSASGANAGYVNFFNEPIFASDCNTIVTKDEYLISTKLIYLFLKLIQDEIYTLQRGQAQPHVYGDDLSRVKVPVLAKDIQEEIIIEIEALEDQEIYAKNEINKLRDSMKIYVANIKGELVALSHITSKVGSGATPLGGEGSYKLQGISLIRSQNIYDNRFSEKGLVFIGEEQADKLKNVIVEKGDILFNITGASIARCCIVPEHYLPARVNQHVAIIRVIDKVLPKYVQAILVSEKYKHQLLEMGKGATSREAITKKQLEDFKIPLPDFSEQQRIVNEIEKIEVDVYKLEQQLNDIPKQKRAVLLKYT